MNVKLRNTFIYILLVILPTLCISSILFLYEKYTMEKENKQAAHTVIFLYRDHLDRYLGEATSALEMLAMVIGAKSQNDPEIQQVLHSTDRTDERFDGLYYANMDLKVSLSSSGLKNPIDITDRSYAKETLKNKQTTVSSAITDRASGHKVIVIATPVFNKNKDVSGLLLATLRFDYIATALNAIKPEYHFEVLDKYGITFLHDNNPKFAPKNTQPITVPLTRLPWRVSIYPLPIEKNILYHNVFTECLITLFLITILFLVIKYILLKRQTKLDRKQNELQKLELVGSFAASTAHEIRNPLTGIKGLITLLKETHTNEKDQFYFSVIEKEIERINEIVSEFLILGKPTAVIEKTYDLRDIVKEVSLIIQSEANLHNVELSIRMPEHPIPIRCSNDHIKQIILNITKNSFEAMSLGDTLTITIEANENTAQLQINDTGKGIPKHIQKQIFHPFFTNKDTGTGLGLVVCKRIIEIYNGQITIESTENIGTTVCIILPLYSQ
ncbi:TPA: histidine kinase [Bacillus pseudomycoides]|nr:histidine kinase [Bacillus pseudomycoides]